MKRVALINDLSGFGKCSLTAAIPVISVMGIQACLVPTAILTAQTGFGDFFCDDFTDKMDYFTEQWKKVEVSFDGIFRNRGLICIRYLWFSYKGAVNSRSCGESNLFFKGSN